MMIDVDGLQVWLIGDPHLGRDFRNGTPLHRRGERETMQLAQFKDELATEADLIIIVGDLFDKPFVPMPIVVEAASALISAAQQSPDHLFAVMAGNHDKSRQLGVKGAWELFSLAVSWVPNIAIIDTPSVIHDVALFPWEWNVSAADQVATLSGLRVSAAVGHWDLMSFGGDESHMAPVEALQTTFGADVSLFSGHYHEEGIFEVAGVEIVCTGSMQPYTHAEDPNGALYVTLTVEEALARDDLRDKCVRILLEPGEAMPEIDCLQLSHKKMEGGTEVLEVEVGLGNFDIHSVVNDEFRENAVPDVVCEYIKERLGAFA